ncbi:MAG: prepilin peptidase [Fidelibacterota bacterium]
MITAYLIVFGLMVGSFLNVCIYRLPRGESLVRPRSHCPHCNRSIKVWENIPLLSYLLLGGRCSSCKKPISIRYPLVEALTGIIFFLTYWRFGLTLDFIFYLAFLCLLVVITFIDIDYQVIPNGLLLIGLIPGVYSLVKEGSSNLELYLFGAVGLGVLFFIIRVVGKMIFRKESLGMGDVKYAALIGLVIGWKFGLLATALAFFSASVILLSMMIISQVSFGQRIPFGPFLSLGTLLATIWGAEIIHWYLKLVL